VDPDSSNHFKSGCKHKTCVRVHRKQRNPENPPVEVLSSGGLWIWILQIISNPDANIKRVLGYIESKEIQKIPLLKFFPLVVCGSGFFKSFQIRMQT
jgi:hypothetical protein